METQLAYLAGIFDGEGTVTLVKVSKDSEFRYPLLSVSNTERVLLEPFRELFGGAISTKKTYQENHKTSYHWKVEYTRALEAMSLLVPFIRHPEKKARVKLLLAEWASVTPRNGKYTDEIKAQKLDLQERFFHPSTS